MIRVSDGYLDNASDPSAGEQLYHFVAELGRAEVALDLANVLFLSSMGLTVLVSLNRQLRAAGGQLIIVNVRPEVGEIFAATHLDSVLEIRPRDPEAPA